MKQENTLKEIKGTKNLNMLYKSLLVGVLAGVVACAYRWVLGKAEEVCFYFYGFLRGNMRLFPVAIVILGVLGYLTGVLVSKFKMISGSGIPQVKGIILGYFKHNWFATLIAKFIGGTLSILAGLSLGREGPSVQLGACIGEGIGEKFSHSRTEKRTLIASGASAGLAAAFNAPLAGAVFSLEEIFKYFSPAILLSAITSAVAADFVSKIIFGLKPVFDFEVKGSIPLSNYWLLIILGALLGCAGAVYNFVLVRTQKLYKKIPQKYAKLRILIPFVLAGCLGIIFPFALCGGHAAIEKLDLSSGVFFLLLLLVVKFIFSMISFGSGAPGGIFFPLLVMGALIGAVFGSISIDFCGVDSGLFYNFIILSMAGFFTAIVKAPITGIILLTEMTGSFNHLLSLSMVSLIAYIVSDLLKSAPIYETLLENQILQSEQNGETKDHNEKTTIEMVVQIGSVCENKLVKEINIPPNCLLVSVKRGGKNLIPKGDTKILAGDYLIFLANACDEANLRENLLKIVAV